MVMTRLQRRLITEVVKPQIRQEAVKDRTLSRLVEDIVAVIEDYSFENVVYLYSYTLGDSTLTSRGNSALPTNAVYYR